MTSDDLIVVRAIMSAFYPSVDAAMSIWLQDRFKNYYTPIRYEYNQITSGNSVHWLFDDNRVLFFSIILQSINKDEIELTITAQASLATKEDLEQVLGMFSYHWDEKQKQRKDENIPSIETLPRPSQFPLRPPPVPKRGRGAPRDPDNEWARAEIRLGRDRRDVFQEYLQRRRVDPKDARALKTARERFKKALQE